MKQIACTDPFEYRMEVFEPPYLFLPQPRPIIHKAPSRVTYTSKFRVRVEDAFMIDKAVFLRYSTSTHSTNFDQRYVEASILLRNATCLYIEAPIDGNIGPPGNYHLFLMNHGKPSIGVTLLIGSGDVLYEEPPENSILFENESKSGSNLSLIGMKRLVLLGLIGFMMCL